MMYYRQMSTMIMITCVLMFGGTNTFADGDMYMTNDSLVLTNKSAKLPVSLKCPLFEFENQTVGGIMPLSIEGDIKGTGKLLLAYPQINLAGGDFLEVRVTLEWSAKHKELHKWARFRVIGNTPNLLLKSIVMDSIDAHGHQVWTHGGRVSQANRYAGNSIQSMPIFTDGFFMGIEFPIATTQVKDGRIELSHSPGLRISPAKWYESRNAIYGIAAPGDEQHAFEQYIIRQGKAIRKLHVNYNSWWSAPPPYDETDILNLMKEIRTNLYDPYHVSIDSFLLDDGWANNHTIWQIDNSRFPNGFANIERYAEDMGCHLGLWMSPSSAYPDSLDNEWARSVGYEAYNYYDRLFLCYAAPKYGAELRKTIPDILKKWDMRVVKTDGILLECSESTHGHEPGALSREAMGEGITRFFDAIHKKNPKVIIEPFGLGYDPSPWWLLYTNEILACQGDDLPPARVPCPVGRESSISGRDYFNLQGATLSPVPISAQEVVGVVHQTNEDFMNDAVTVLMRGNLFLPLYINPSFMTDIRWRNLAEYIKWARRNQSSLTETVPLLPESWQNGGVPRFTWDSIMPREPYGYAHIKGNKGLIHLRNPWIAEQTYHLVLDKSIGFNRKAHDLNAVSIYPEPRVYFRDLRYGDVVDVHLAPYETVVLSVSSNEISGELPDAGASKGGVDANTQAFDIETVRLDATPDEAASKLFGGTDLSKAYNHMKLRFDTNVGSKKARVLLLLESDQPIDSMAYGLITLDGKTMVMNKCESRGVWSATGLPEAEHWIFLENEIGQGKHSVDIEALFASAPVKVSAWLWGTNEGGKLSSYPNSFPEPEEISINSAVILEETRIDGTGTPAKAVPIPGESINGVFLDSLEPISSHQDWGTLSKNKSVWGKPITINGKEFLRGLGTHANSSIIYNLDGKYSTFRAWVGQDYAISGSVSFEVLVDGEKKWSSGIMKRHDDPKLVEVDITGASKIELVVTDGGDGITGDHADWADACLLR